MKAEHLYVEALLETVGGGIHTRVKCSFYDTENLAHI
jgi:hypothetical protein